MANNSDRMDFDVEEFINYERSKTKPVDKMSNGYKALDAERGEASNEKPSNVENLKAMHEKNPDALNATQKLILGFANLDEKKNADRKAESTYHNE